MYKWAESCPVARDEAGPKDPIYFESTFDDTQSPYSDDHVYSIKEKAYSNYWLETVLSLADAEMPLERKLSSVTFDINGMDIEAVGVY